MNKGVEDERMMHKGVNEEWWRWKSEGGGNQEQRLKRSQQGKVGEDEWWRRM